MQPRRACQKSTETIHPDAMELKYSPLSPFGRKVMIIVHELGIAPRLRLTRVSTRGEPDKLTPYNPLGKIPVLVTEAGAVLYDSAVICEYIDAEFGNHRFIPAHGLRRWEVLTRSALADGVMEAGVAVRYERNNRPAHEQSPTQIEWQLKKVRLGFDRYEEIIDTWDGTLDLGHIGIACAIGYLEARLPELSGMSAWPKLWAWYRQQCAGRPSFERTQPLE